ncbi:MAG: FAD-dependent monooxygenase [Hamadaea sp.]|uniref:FAD-dependent oxidoreductase n=1 Tax=Hamadaea sp. TaxID=2024425 RepID=UPI0017A98F56|nr:NAD(P)/FAD-dependent oxidoreductase [Hamadaea sp.]NUR70893.1 FAD-dependent monooxygenase [Hamadaea sp.]NUT21680.1 FAD-dependent monooxygenase [Hamadaea sp.]
MTGKIRNALIIGGGVAGPVLAMALQKAGIDSVVYEAYAGTADGKGGGLSIAPNGMEALKVIDADEPVRALGKPMTGIVLQDWKGDRLGEFGNPPGIAPMLFMFRHEVYRALLDEAAKRGIRIETGKRLVDAVETTDGVTARFADGTEATGDILIGADGIRSVTRKLIDPNAPEPAYTGLISFGALIPQPGVPSTGGKMNMPFGKKGFFGYQVFDDDTAVWFVNLPNPEPLTLAQVKETPAEEWLRRLPPLYAEDRTPAADLIARTAPEELILVGPMEKMPRVPKWSRGRLVLVGDSVHAPSSSSGQGASLAIESAIELARCLRDLPYDEAFSAYEQTRRPRVERVIAATDRKNAAKAAGPVMRVINAWAIKAFARMAKPEKMAWVFQNRIDWDSPA